MRKIYQPEIINGHKFGLYSSVVKAQKAIVDYAEDKCIAFKKVNKYAYDLGEFPALQRISIEVLILE